MRDLVPVKVKIGLKSNGHAKYPNFNVLQAVINAGIDWAQYIDIYGMGWYYDKVSGHQDDSPESPFGQQWGVMVVPKDFADEAISRFPQECTKLTENELEIFIDERALAHIPDEDINLEVLQGIREKQALGLELTAWQIKALDPNDDTPGIKKNKEKTWKGIKEKKGVKIVQ